MKRWTDNWYGKRGREKLIYELFNSITLNGDLLPPPSCCLCRTSATPCTTRLVPLTFVVEKLSIVAGNKGPLLHKPCKWFYGVIWGSGFQSDGRNPHHHLCHREFFGSRCLQKSESDRTFSLFSYWNCWAFEPSPPRPSHLPILTLLLNVFLLTID